MFVFIGLRKRKKRGGQIESKKERDGRCPIQGRELNGSHKIFIWSWDAFTTTRSITDDTTTTNTFANIKPEHHFETNEGIQSKLLEKEEWMRERETR